VVGMLRGLCIAVHTCTCASLVHLPLLEQACLVVPRTAGCSPTLKKGVLNICKTSGVFATGNKQENLESP
jgi:hypothetical protein